MKLTLDVIAGALRQMADSGGYWRDPEGIWHRMKVETAPAPEPARKPEPPKGDDVTTKTRTCPACKETKPATEFHSNGYCKPCGREKARVRYLNEKAEKGAKPAPAAAAKKKAPPPELAAGEVIVTQITSIELTDVEGRRHSIRLNEAQIAVLRTALGDAA